MKKPPQISIVIPAYNRLNYLKRCLESIKLQKYRDYEIIVVDDCSTENVDEVAPLCDKYIKNEINMGPSYSKNVGALNSSGEILLFLDSDVVLMPKALKNLPDIFKKDEKIGAIGGEGPPDRLGKDAKYVRRIYYSSHGRKTVKPCPKPDDGEKPRLYDVDIIATAFLAIPKDVYRSLGGFDPYFYYVGEDRDLCFRLKEQGYRLVVRADINAVHFSTKTGNRYKSPAKVTWMLYYMNKCLEAEIKRGGVWGGIMWMVANFWSLPLFFLFIKTFKKSEHITKRKNTDYLKAEQMEKYLQLQIQNHLKQRLDFKVRFPLPTPKNIVLFVTSDCNGLCDHCFMQGIPKSEDEMDIDKAVKMFKRLETPVRLILTGGEPFLRDDIEEVIGRLLGQKQTKSVYITSNGSLPEKTEAVCSSICKSYKKPVYLQISLDGMEKTHNLIRKIPDGFNKAIETCRRLKLLKQRYPHLSYVINISIMKSNLEEVENLITYLEGEKHPSKVTPVRGNSFSTFNVPCQILNPQYNPRLEVSPSVEEIQKVLKNIQEKHPKYFKTFQKIRLKLMLDTLSLKSRQIPCYAGYEDAVIYSDGTIGFCEQIMPFSNLSEWDWNLSNAWNSTESMQQRMKLLSCACIHGCNIVPAIKKNITKGNLLTKITRFLILRQKIP